MTRPATDRSPQTGDTSLRDAFALGATGLIEVMRVTRLLRKAHDVMHFAGVPASSRSHVRELEVSFVKGDAPSPRYDPVTGLLRLFYAERERHEVERVLTSKRSRYCYFCGARDRTQRHAWLLTSP